MNLMARGAYNKDMCQVYKRVIVTSLHLGRALLKNGNVDSKDEHHNAHMGNMMDKLHLGHTIGKAVTSVHWS